MSSYPTMMTGTQGETFLTAQMPDVSSPTPTPYLGVVATRTNVCRRFTSVASWQNVRSMHYLRDWVTTVRVAFPGFWVNPATHLETAMGATTAVTASIEYPAGVFTQLKFSGAVTGTIPDGGLLWSDPVAILIPKGAQFWVRTFSHCVPGGMYRGPYLIYPAAGEVFEYSPNATPITDKTMGGTIPSTESVPLNQGCQPVAIVGLTTRPSVALIGDSLVEGQGDTYSGPGDIGIYARSVGPVYAYTVLATGGDTASGFAASHTNRAALAAFCSHSIIDYGINDYLAGQSDAAIRASITLDIAALPPGQVKYISTLPPYTTSTDSWATIGNQTLTAYEAVKAANNVWRRSLPAGFAAVFDVDSVVEYLATSKWKVTGAAFGWTGDGIHPSTYGYQQVAASGVINTGIMKVT